MFAQSVSLIRTNTTYFTFMYAHAHNLWVGLACTLLATFSTNGITDSPYPSPRLAELQDENNPRKSRLAVLDAVTLYTNLSMRKRKSKAPEQDEDWLRAGQRQLAATSSRSLSRTRTHGATKRVRITYVRVVLSDHAKVVFPPMNSIHTVRSYRASGEEQWHNII